MSNLTIANILLGFSILCLALSAEAGLALYFIYSMVAIVLAGAIRYDQLPERPSRSGRQKQRQRR